MRLNTEYVRALFYENRDKKQDKPTSFPRTWESRTRQIHTKPPLGPRVRGDDGLGLWPSHVRAVVIVILCCMVSPVWGHGIDLFARVDGGQIVGTLAHEDGTAVQDGPISAFAPDGSILEETRTDQNGKFTIPLRFRVPYRLVGDGGHGHRGEFTVPESEIPETYPAFDGTEQAAGTGAIAKKSGSAANVDVGVLESAIARQLGPLRDQLHAHEKQVRLRDVFGGIGYVFGIFGIYVLLKQRRTSKNAD
ncbi:MAG: hypothetical protein L3K26_01190 [Candidatus Hydrogenedentes bacterium]|nr:hypothetical protein [Candidatus Hydrogenedentota bacterium]